MLQVEGSHTQDTLLRFSMPPQINLCGSVCLCETYQQEAWTGAQQQKRHKAHSSTGAQTMSGASTCIATRIAIWHIKIMHPAHTTLSTLSSCQVSEERLVAGWCVEGFAQHDQIRAGATTKNSLLISSHTPLDTDSRFQNADCTTQLRFEQGS